MCLKFYVELKFEEDLSKSCLEKLERFLKYPNHKIVALDMSSDTFKESEIMKVIEILNKPDIDNSKIDVINFGQRKFYEK